jgi:hypothetical protein
MSKSLIILIVLISLFSLGVAPVPTLAQYATPKPTEYKLLEPIPQLLKSGSQTTGDTQSFIPGLFRLAIAIATGMATLMLIYAGIQYMSTDAWNEKNEAKGTIQNAIVGLLLTLSAWLIIYTINPNLVKFDLNIPSYNIKEGDLGAPSAGSAAGTGCQGNCPYSYMAGPVEIKYRDCSSCSDANSFGLDIKHDIVGGKKAQLNTDLGNKLKAIQSVGGNPTFRVTETWPPTSNHKDQGQYQGTSVDVSLNNPTTPNIISFINNARGQGLSAVYEVGNEARKIYYVNAGLPATSIIVVPYISAEHFSVK